MYCIYIIGVQAFKHSSSHAITSACVLYGSSCDRMLCTCNCTILLAPLQEDDPRLGSGNGTDIAENIVPSPTLSGNNSMLFMQC